jgi:multiple sugar transport system permease protein
MTTVSSTAPSRRRRRKRTSPWRVAERVFLYVLVIVLATLFVAPLVWGFLGSLKDPLAGVTGPAIPDDLRWDNYRYAWDGDFSFASYLWNTVVLTLLATVPAVFTSAFAGYAFARMHAPAKNLTFLLVLATTFIPVSIIFIPFFWVVVKLGMYQTLWPWFIWGVAGSAFLIFFFRQFYAGFPQALDDAAALDGCGHIRTFAQIYLPNSIGPFVVGFVILGTGWWGEYFYAQLLLPDDQLPLGPKIAGGYLDESNQFALTSVTLAGSFLFTLPVLIVFFLLQKRLTQGIVTTGVKG